MAGARRVIFGIKLSEAEATECDTARGEMPRSEWGRAALLAAAEQRWTVIPGLDDNGEAAFVAEVLAASGMQDQITAGVHREMVARVRLPKRTECPHPKARVLKGMCGACGTGGLSGG